MLLSLPLELLLGLHQPDGHAVHVVLHVGLGDAGQHRLLLLLLDLLLELPVRQLHPLHSGAVVHVDLLEQSVDLSQLSPLSANLLLLVTQELPQLVHLHKIDL